MSLAERVAAYAAATRAFEEQVSALDHATLDAKHPADHGEQLAKALRGEK